MEIKFTKKEVFEIIKDEVADMLERALYSKDMTVEDRWDGFVVTIKEGYQEPF